jgi:hypothetical protein
MTCRRLALFCLVALCGLATAADALAQQRIRMVPCRVSDCWGGPSPDDSMTPTVRLIQQKAMGLAPLLPSDIEIEVMIVGGYDFSHRYQPSRPHLITIGVQALAELHNNWSASFYTGGQNVAEAFGAIVEWTFYHEVGHALIEHALGRTTSLKNNDQDHERLADRFATVALMFANRDAARRATYASQGIYAMRLASAQAMSVEGPDVRNALERRARPRPKVVKQRGLDGLRGVHNPTAYRAWDVKCYVWGSGLGPNPGPLRSMHNGMLREDICNAHDFNNAIWELRQYAPFLPQVPLNRVTRYNPQTRRLQ